MHMSCHLGILESSDLDILGSSSLNSHLLLFLSLAVHLQTENCFCPFFLDASGHSNAKETCLGGSENKSTNPF